MPALGQSIVTPEIVDIICQRIEGGRTLRVARDDDLPGRQAIYDAIKRDQSVADAIARARREGAHALAESVMDIADECTDPAMVQLIRNRCDQRRWLAGKYNSMYADRPGDVNANVNLMSLIEASYEAPAVDHEASTTDKLSIEPPHKR